MSQYRKNTLVVDFGVLPRRPALEEAEKFLKCFVKLDMADVRSIQIHNIKNCLFIEMNDPGVAPRLQKLHHLQHCFVLEGVKYYIPVYVDGPTTTVRIHDLPPQMCNNSIADHLQQYGRVISIHNEVWKNFFSGIPNGVRVVRMRLDKPIPSHIVVNSHGTYVSYPNNSDQQAIRSTKQKQQKTPSSSVKGQKNDDNQCDTIEPEAARSDRDGGDDDDNDNDDGNTDVENENDVNLETDSAKRRLSTESTNGTRDENLAKRSCNENVQNSGSTWKVITRSKKKNMS
ncbi:protein PFC0760c-like [Aedes albopictus]|uniref:Translation elongation factor ef-1 alpha/tu n=1 Tax=Aedes albopictus TaxID=7160 RepID=A0ABM1Y6M1_AEDAL